GGGFEMMASSPLRGLGFDLRFGGVFTSVPTAVAAMVSPHGESTTGSVTTVGTVNAPPSIGHGPAGGGGITTLLTERIDLFGLGSDYAMYHKRFLGTFDQDDLPPWQKLDGIFTSAPAAIA